jgi:hypothetical protein
MKKFISILALLVVINSINAEIIEKTFYFSNYQIVNEKGYCFINFNNTLNTGIEGEPVLPYHSVSLLLPPGHIAETVEFIGDKEVIIDGTFMLYPQQASRPLSEGTTGVFQIKQDVYNSSSLYPSKPTGNYSTEFLNGHSFLISSFTPVMYIPKDGKVSYYRKVTIRVTTKPDREAEKALENLKTGNSIDSRVEKFAQNPKMILHYPVINNRSEDDYQMMIITPSVFENSFDDLINMYIQRGIIAKVATTEYIDANITGQDLAEKMRNYIIQEYQANAVEYILLGGDVEYVPYRGFYCSVLSGGQTIEDSNIPADLYFSALDGTWNDDGDNKWGEPDEDDLLPDVSVSRFPVSNASELENMIHKSISYQNQPVLGELTKPLLVGEFALNDPETWGADYLDLLIGYHGDNGYETTGIPENDNYDTLYDRASTWQPNQLITKINNGTSFIYHVGHSDFNYLMKMYSDNITNSTFSQVNGVDHNYTLVYTHGCMCGGFDQSDCIAEEMVTIENFAAGGAFNSRYGWFNEGQTEGPSEHLNREFVDALYAQKKGRIGETHKISKIETSPWVTASGQWEEGAQRWCFYDCNFFGDPAMSVWTAEPIDIDVAYENTFAVNAGSTQLTVTLGSDAVKGLNCVLLKDNTILGQAVTNENGEAIIQFSETVAEPGPAQIVVSGYNCLPQIFDVTITPLTSIGDISTVEDISVFPNPASFILNISSPKVTEISFYNLLGEKVKLLKLSKGGSSIDISDLHNGLYILQLRTKEKTTSKKLMIKNVCAPRSN